MTVVHDGWALNWQDSKTRDKVMAENYTRMEAPLHACLAHGLDRLGGLARNVD